MPKKVVKKTAKKMVKDVAAIEEMATEIAEQIAYDVDNALCGVFTDWKDDVQKLIAQYGATTVQAVFKRVYVEHVNEEVNTVADLMGQLS